MFENNQIGIANFNSNSTEILYWHAKAIEGFVFSGDNFLEQAQNLSLKIGTM
jgi:hypothetical protein